MSIHSVQPGHNNKSKAVAENLSRQKAPAPAFADMRPEAIAQRKLKEVLDGRNPKNSFPVQRTRIFDANVEPADIAVLQQLLDSNPMLMEAWQWLKYHPTINFTVRRRDDGMNSINARLGQTNIVFNMNPLMQVGDNEFARDPEWITTVSHELNLHLLPWVRIMMTLELTENENNMAAYNADQLERIRAVLGSVTPDSGPVSTEVLADFANKETTSFGGNHSDLGLWTYHLEDLLRLAGAAGPAGGVALVARGIENMVNPIRITGMLKDVIARGPGMVAAFNHALSQVNAYRGHMAGAMRDNFDQHMALITQRATLFSHALAVLPVIRAQLPGHAIDEGQLVRAITAGNDAGDRASRYIAAVRPAAAAGAGAAAAAAPAAAAAASASGDDAKKLG